MDGYKATIPFSSASSSSSSSVRVRRELSPFLLLLLFFVSGIMAAQNNVNKKASVHIVYLADVPPENADHEAIHVQKLASVFPSEEEARNALLYSYKNTLNGFSAKLTPEQVEALSKQPGVLQVQESLVYDLHGGATTDAV